MLMMLKAAGSEIALRRITCGLELSVLRCRTMRSSRARFSSTISSPRPTRFCRTTSELPRLLGLTRSLIRNVAHRHEPPVVTGMINIVARDEARGLVVVEKPGSMPVHPTGRYNFNTLLEILKHAHGLEKVHTANRLDRLTSGVMVCATTLEASRFLGALFATEGAVQKEYLARVSGCFPEEEVVCEEPLLTIDRQLGLNVVHPDGRSARTIFKRLSYHARTDTSVLHCRPITGRSHQIRVHLQFLGYPISNDPIYSSQVWGHQGGPQSAKGGFFRDPEWLAEQALKEEKERDLISTEDLRLSSTLPVPRELHQIVKDLRQLRDQETPERLLARDRLQPSVLSEATNDDLHNEPAGPFGPATMDFRTEDETGPYCRACGVPLLEDPKPEHLFIWLHALRCAW